MRDRPNGSLTESKSKQVSSLIDKCIDDSEVLDQSGIIREELRRAKAIIQEALSEVHDQLIYSHRLVFDVQKLITLLRGSIFIFIFWMMQIL